MGYCCICCMVLYACVVYCICWENSYPSTCCIASVVHVVSYALWLCFVILCCCLSVACFSWALCFSGTTLKHESACFCTREAMIWKLMMMVSSDAEMSVSSFGICSMLRLLLVIGCFLAYYHYYYYYYHHHHYHYHYYYDYYYYHYCVYHYYYDHHY